MASKFFVWFYNYKVVPEYAKSNLSVHGEHAYKRIWRIRQECFAVYGEYANRHKSEPISANFRPNLEKIVILNHLTGQKNLFTPLSL
jgi:hypothetical protein